MSPLVLDPTTFGGVWGVVQGFRGIARADISQPHFLGFSGLSWRKDKNVGGRTDGEEAPELAPLLGRYVTCCLQVDDNCEEEETLSE